MFVAICSLFGLMFLSGCIGYAIGWTANEKSWRK